MPPTTPLLLFMGAVIVTVVLGRWSMIIALAALNFSTSTVEWTDKSADEDKPDILLVTIDTLRLDAAKGMSIWNALSSEGVGYDAQASSPWTLPSMASIMTGLEPFRHGAGRTPEGYTVMSPEDPTLAELLRNEGYDTAATVHSPFMDVGFGFSRGFDQLRNEQYDLWVLPAIINSSKTQPLGAFLAQELGLIDDARTHARGRVLDTEDFVNARRDDHPLFLWIHLLDAHIPYRHGSDLDRPFADRWLATHADYADLGPVPTPHELEVLRAAYLHEVEVVDAAVTEILEIFSERDRGRVVVVSSDHGEEFGEHDGWEHGHTLYQELLAVPLVITGIEGLKAGDAGLIDITPTLLGAAGVSAFGFDGRDLRFKAHNPPYRSVNPLYGDMFRRAVKVGDQKLIAEGDSRLQFDLSVDGGEKTPTAPDAHVVAELPPEELGGGVPAVMDKRTKAALEALGYLD